MDTRFKTVDRQTPLLMSPDMRSWVPDDDLVHFVLLAVEGVPMSTFSVNRRGSGSEQYPPRMLLARELDEQLRLEIDSLLKQAEEADASGAGDPQQLTTDNRQPLPAARRRKTG